MIYPFLAIVLLLAKPALHGDLLAGYFGAGQEAAGGCGPLHAPSRSRCAGCNHGEAEEVRAACLSTVVGHELVES